MSDLFAQTIETDRLLLERLCHENVDALDLYDCFAAGVADEAVFEHVPEEPWHAPKEAHDRIADAEENWCEGRTAEYVVRPRAEVEGMEKVGEGKELEEEGKESEEEGGRAKEESHAGEIAGLANLNCQWERRTGVLGLVLRKPFWGRGYSGERAAALMDLAFDRLDLEVVTAGCNEGNEQSRRAIEKYVERFGGQYDGVIRNCVPMGEEIADLHRYTVTREQWSEATKGE